MNTKVQEGRTMTDAERVKAQAERALLIIPRGQSVAVPLTRDNAYEWLAGCEYPANEGADMAAAFVVFIRELIARVQEMEEQAHYATGVAQLAMKHRDIAEAKAQALDGVMVLLCDVAQLLDGWHQDGTAWSAWDESVRKRVGAAMASIPPEPGCARER